MHCLFHVVVVFFLSFFSSILVSRIFPWEATVNPSELSQLQ